MGRPIAPVPAGGGGSYQKGLPEAGPFRSMAICTCGGVPPVEGKKPNSMAKKTVPRSAVVAKKFRSVSRSKGTGAPGAPPIIQPMPSVRPAP